MTQKRNIPTCEKSEKKGGHVKTNAAAHAAAAAAARCMHAKQGGIA